MPTVATLGEKRASGIGSEEILYFLDTAQAATVAVDSTTHKATVTGGTLNMMLLTADNNTFSNNGSLEEQNDVTQKLAISNVSFGQATMDISQNFLKEDPVCQKFFDLYMKKPVGSDAAFTICRVDTWDSNKVYVANCAIVCTEYGGSAQEKAQVSVNIGLTSDWIECATAGVIDPSTGVLTFAV